MSSVMRWLQMFPAFQEQYRVAREEQVEAYVDQMVDIADDQTEDAKSRQVRINARIWAASKLKPKKYGELASNLPPIDKLQLMIVMPTAAEATNRVQQLQAPVIEAEVVEPE